MRRVTPFRMKKEGLPKVPDTKGHSGLGREDSNLRMVESKSTALPLGDAPIGRLESGGTIDFPRLSLGYAGL